MTDDWYDGLIALLDAGARFLVVGAHALAVHGVPRGTQDLDIWLDATRDNAARVIHGLTAFGAPLDALGITTSNFTRTGMVIQLGLPPHRIDLLTSISGVTDFDRAWDDRVEQEIRGRRVPFIGRATLVINKRHAGRSKDLADLDALNEPRQE